MNFFVLKSFSIFTPLMQIILIGILFFVTTFIQYTEYKKTGKMYKYYPVRISLLFAPVYEEIIFRGFILGGLMLYYSATIAIIISSILFGLWHVKNIFFQPAKETVWQILYTGIIFGPIASYITIWTGTLWLAVIIHYLNNIIAPYSRRLLARQKTA